MTIINLSAYLVALASDSESSLLSPDQMAGYAVTAVFTIINLVPAYIILKLFVFKRVFKVIHKREDQIKAQVIEAEEANAKAQDMINQGKAAVDKAREDAAGIITEAKEVAEKQAELIISKSTEEATFIISRADQEARRAKRVAIEDMKDELSDLAVAISAKVMGDVVSQETLKELSDKHTAETLEAEVKKFD